MSETNATTPALIDAVAAAAMCGVSRSCWLKQTAAGKTPRPVRIGRAVRWNRDELMAWIAAGCPARSKWESARSK